MNINGEVVIRAGVSAAPGRHRNGADHCQPDGPRRHRAALARATGVLERPTILTTVRGYRERQPLKVIAATKW
jgi:hypothetical protein